MKTKTNSFAVWMWLITLASGYGQPAVIQFTTANYSVSETGIAAIITVEITWGDPFNVYTVDYAATDGSATAGVDFLAQAGTLSFEYPETNKTFSVPILNDFFEESAETVTLTLSNPAFDAVLSQSNAVLVIESDDLGPLDYWQWRTAVPTANLLHGVIYGSNQFVAVGSEGTILSSRDGEVWSVSPIAGTPELRAVGYGNGRYVAVGYTDEFLPSIWTSPDGVRWTEGCVPGLEAGLLDVTFANGLFVAVGILFNVPGGARVILTSPDGLTWTDRTPRRRGQLSGVCYGNGQFVAVGYPRHILTSPDGISWTDQFSGTDGLLRDVTFGNGLFVAVGNRYDANKGRDVTLVLSSPDAVTWTAQSNGGSNLWVAATYGNGRFAAVGGGTVAVSEDGKNWIETVFGTSLADVVYGNGKFVAVGDGVALSTDGQTYRMHNASFTSGLFGVAHGNGKFVAVSCCGGAFLTSADGVSWTRQENPGDYWLTTITWGNGLFVAVGNASLTSLDGIIWTERDAGEAAQFYDVTFGGDKFVAVGCCGAVATSMDGETWTRQQLDPGYHLNGVAWGNGCFVAVGESAKILTSPDGISWVERSSGICWSLHDVAYGNGLFVAVSDPLRGLQRLANAAGQAFGAEAAPQKFGTIVTSPDGITWTVRLATHSFAGVAYGDGSFVAVGGSSAGRQGYSWIFSSPDGIAWTPRQSPVTSVLRAVTYGPGSFVAVGDGGVILQSHVLPRLTVQFDSLATMSLFGPPDRPYRIEFVNELHETNHWQTLTNFQLQTSPTKWTDLQSTNAPRRFYRAVQMP